MSAGDSTTAGAQQSATASGSTPAGDNSKMWAVLSLVASLGAAALAKRGLDAGWKLLTGKKPPENPADPDVATREAVMWAVASGASVALARMLANRRAANYFVKSTGHLPGQLAADGNVSGKKADKKSKKK